MNGKLMNKLAVRNLKGNRKFYLPYFGAAAVTICMFFMMTSLKFNDYLSTRSAILPQLFQFGIYVIGIFSLIFLLYTNSFLFKQRKKELGLYAVLGLKKKHVASVLARELWIISAASLVSGILSGTILGNLVFLGLNKLLHFPVKMNFQFSLPAVGITVLFFLSVFILTWLMNVGQMVRLNPTQLISGKKAGEKEPKSSFLLFLAALGCLGTAYWFSLTIKDPIGALNKFFLAVLLVIIGTYLLFTSGSIFILKRMKRNKKLYYKPDAFLSISGMLYRMKQNAVGLGNIAILSTMVLVAVSTTAAIYSGTEQTIQQRFPFENNIKVFEPEKKEEILGKVQELTEKNSMQIKNEQAYQYINASGDIKEDKFLPWSYEKRGARSIPLFMELLSYEDYLDMVSEPVHLKENELLVYDSEGKYKQEKLEIEGHVFQVKRSEEKPFVESDAILSQTFLVVAPPNTEIEEIVNPEDETIAASKSTVIRWNTSGTEAEKLAYAENRITPLNENWSIYYQSKLMTKEEFYQLNGGLLFLGIFLGLLFASGTVLITYFKQVSEGYDDREKFQIMQKVGLDQEMIQSSTKSQVVWMFFLPLAVAVMHIAFAFPIIHQLLILFGIVDKKVLLVSFAVSIAVFSLFYYIVYRITSRIYYSIVK